MEKKDFEALMETKAQELRTKRSTPTPTIIKNNESGKDAVAQILQRCILVKK